MRIVVLSDSHGDEYKLRLALEQQPGAKYMFFLGDGERDIDGLSLHIPVIKVRGNCDWGSQLPASSTDWIEDVKIYSTHGYAENVKYGMGGLISAAKDVKAHIALYGHTHNPVTEYVDGIWFVNPGSIRDGNYAVIDITKSGIMPILMKIRY